MSQMEEVIDKPNFSKQKLEGSEGKSEKTRNVGQDLQKKIPEILSLPIGEIRPNPKQPRKIFQESLLKELAESIRKDGVIQPIVVTKQEGESHYLLIAGERRWRAAQLAGELFIPAVLRETASKNLLKVALIENIQRQDLNVIEEAEAYKMLIDEENITQEQCADLVSRDRASVSNILRLLKLPREIQSDVSLGRLTLGHGKALLGLDSIKQMLKCRDLILKRSLSVRQTEQLVQAMKNAPVSNKGNSQLDPDLGYLADILRSFFQTKIKISGKPNRGKIEISYFSTSELERILKLMGHSVS